MNQPSLSYSSKTVLFFGIYDPKYSRNQILIQGFRENGWNVAQCRVDPKEHRGLKKYRELMKVWSNIKSRVNPDLILVAFPGHTVVWLAHFLFSRKRIIFDAFLSRFDSNVYDRKSYRVWSLRGIFDWLLDWSSCVISRTILLDTEEHIKYFSKKFFVKKSKMLRVPVGANTFHFYPRESKDNLGKFNVYFQGMFIPLQGIQYIVDAAEKLVAYPDIVFTIVGDGQEYKEVSDLIAQKRLSNIILSGVQPLEKLPEFISKADICLGIFGNTEKATRVIPNKVYEYIAMKKAVITSDTSAIREFFINEKDMLLCKRADGEEIAKAILRLKNDPELASSLAYSAHEYFVSYMKSKIIVSELLSHLY